MPTVLRRIVLGARWSDEVGSHPGTTSLIMFTIIGAIAGADRGHWTGPVLGSAFMLAGCGSLWIHGCYRRGVYVERSREKENAVGGTGGTAR